MFHRYKMTILYDGTHYCGWQRQTNGLSIQQKVEDALEILLRHPTVVIGSGRTDAGVHAQGQVAHFNSEKPLPIQKTLISLNGILPLDIRITSLQEIDAEFHARFSALSKIYHYHIHRGISHNPFNYLYSIHLRDELNIPAMQYASTYFLGKHDFTSFANDCREGSAKTNPIKTIYRCEVIPTDFGLRLEFHGSGFLYKMVRNMVGVLLEIGIGKIQPDIILEMLAALDRRSVCQAAPAKGLFLMQVEYPEKFS